MEYETIVNEDGDIEVINRTVERYPVELISWNPTLDPQQTGAPTVTRVRTLQFTGVIRRTLPVSESPRQDTLASAPGARVPKTRGGTDEFISAFWVSGKPKCRKGYRYDFNKKMCRIIK